MMSSSSDELSDDPRMRVTITETELVKCCAQQEEHPEVVVELSNLDRQCPHHMYLVFFYKLLDPAGCSLDSVFECFKSGLEKTLSIWYPAAGTLWINDDINQLGANLLCNNTGVVVAKANTWVEISELGHDLSQYNPFFDYLVYKPPPLPLSGDQMPLVAAQVTKFGCGGYSIGIGISHSLFDGPSAYAFMCTWASNTRRLLLGMDEPAAAVRVVHDRDALLELHVDDGELEGRPAAIDHLYQLIMQSSATVASIQSSNNNSSYVHKTFHLSSAFLASLKEQLLGDVVHYSCSSFELVAAHLWKAKTLAMGVSKEAMVCLQFAVDVRNKVEPPLGQAFTGNAYVLASLALSASQLVDQSDHKAIVHKIREAKMYAMTNKYVKSYMEALAAGAGGTSLPPLKELTLLSDWTRMPFHKVGFLQAEADCASPLVAPVPEVIYFMQNPEDDKAIDIRIGLLPHYIDAFTHHFFTIITS